jgi:hypothetical protein
MVILEKFSFYRKMLGSYFLTRFLIPRYAVFALLLVLLGQPELYLSAVLIKQCIFVFLTLFVFRWMDDAASFYIDRIDHPSRIYVRKEQFKHFLLMGSIFMLIYLGGIFLFSLKLALIMDGLVVGSLFLYLIFYRRRTVMLLIPLLKYPVMIWCIAGSVFTQEIILLMAACFVMLLGIDLFRKDHTSWQSSLIHIFVLLATGLLILQPWSEQESLLADLFMVIIPAMLILLIPVRKIYLFPVILFPIFHIFDLLI